MRPSWPEAEGRERLDRVVGSAEPPRGIPRTRRCRRRSAWTASSPRGGGHRRGEVCRSAAGSTPGGAFSARRASAPERGDHRRSTTICSRPRSTPAASAAVEQTSCSLKNAARSAERGFNFIGPEIGYDAALTAAGRNPADYKIASMQVIHVSDSTDKAWEEAGAGIEYFVNFYNIRLNLDGQPQGNESDHPGDAPRRECRVLVGSSRHSRRRDQGAHALRLRPARPHHRARLRVPPRQACATTSCTTRCACSTST